MSDYGQPDPNQYPNTIRSGDPVPPDSVVGNSPLWQGGQHQAPKPPKKKGRTLGVIGIVVGFLLVLLIVAVALTPGSPNADAPASVTSQAGTPVVTPTTKPSAVKPTTQPSPKVTHKPAPKLTASQVQAIGSAESYLSFTAFSRKGLIRQLSSDAGEGFSVADATFAVDHVKVDWDEQAVKKAREYLSLQHFSRKGLIHQLEAGEQFTHAQAVYGVTKAGL
jgi:hypothetical protein